MILQGPEEAAPTLAVAGPERREGTRRGPETREGGFLAAPTLAVAGPERREVTGREPETGKAVFLAAATMAANLVAVVFTVLFTRLLGADGYGSLAALLNLTVILFVPGSALQVAAAREATLGRLGRGGELAGTLTCWSCHIIVALALVAVASAIARKPLAQLIN